MAVVTFQRVVLKLVLRAASKKGLDVAFWDISLTITTQCNTALRWLALTAQQDSDGFDSASGFIGMCVLWELASLKWLQFCVPMLMFDFQFGGPAMNLVHWALFFFCLFLI